MKTTITAAQVAGAQHICVQEEHAAFKPILRRELMRAIGTASRTMKLKTSDLVVIDSLLSFLPCRDIKTKADLPITADMVLVIYASNETICGRAKGMDERTLRRHLKRLSDLGLLRRKDSATGKRFPLKRNGKVVDAFGLDIAPLLQNAERIIDLAHKVKVEAEEIRSLRAQALTIRAQLLRQMDTLAETTLEAVENAKTLLRRASLTLEDVRAILQNLLQIACDAPCPATDVANQDSTKPSLVDSAQPEDLGDNTPPDDVLQTENTTATNGQIDRQVESQKIYTNKKTALRQIHPLELWSNCSNVAAFFPEEPRSEAHLKQTVYQAGNVAAVKERTMADAIHSIGWSRVLQAIDYLIGNAHRIKSPDAYMRSIIEDSLLSRTVHQG